MKLISLTQGKFAIVDDEDFEFLNQWKWQYKRGYAVRRKAYKRINGKQPSTTIYMHRVINKTPDGFQTDHINRNKLDNRQCNLRNATARTNAYNTGLRRDNTSGFKGVCWDKNRKDWVAKIVVNYKRIHLGRFKNIKKAIFARNQAEKIYYAF